MPLPRGPSLLCTSEVTCCGTTLLSQLTVCAHTNVSEMFSFLYFPF